MSRLVATVALIVGVGIFAGCGTGELPSAGEPSARPSIDRETPETEASNAETDALIWSADARRLFYPITEDQLDGTCVVPAARLEELEDRLGAEFEESLLAWSSDGTYVAFRIPCDDALRARIESML